MKNMLSKENCKDDSYFQFSKIIVWIKMILIFYYLRFYQINSINVINILQVYTRLYEATGRRIEQSKSYCYKWKQSDKGGKRMIIDRPINIEVYSEKLTELKCDETIRALGIYINPSLKQEKQFTIMKQKMLQSIAKIMNTNMNTYQIHIYFNMYLVRSVFFGSRIISLNEKQLRVLEKMY